MIPPPGGGGPKVYLGPIKTPLHALFTDSMLKCSLHFWPQHLLPGKVHILICCLFFLCQHHHHRHIVWLYHPPSSGRHEFETFMNVENHHLWQVWKKRPAGKCQYWKAEQGGEKVVVVASRSIYFTFLNDQLLGTSLMYPEYWVISFGKNDPGIRLICNCICTQGSDRRHRWRNTNI